MQIHERFNIPAENWARLVKELEFYKAHQAEFLPKYNGKYLVLHNLHVAGAFDSSTEASNFATTNFAPATFLIQKCSAGDRDYTVKLAFRTNI